jgi:splicing factor 1
MRSSKWSRRGDRFAIPNVPCVLPPGTANPLLRSLLLRARFEELQYLLAHLPRESPDVARFSDELSRAGAAAPGARGPRDDHRQAQMRVRDALFRERRSVICAADEVLPVFRVPAAARIAFTKCTRKFHIANPSLVGYILGPQGASLKALEREFQVRISIRGRGLAVQRAGAAGDADEPLYALIEGTTERLLDACVARLEALMAPPPDSENERKKDQLRFLAVLRGTVSSEAAFCDDFGRPGARPPWFDESVAAPRSAELDDAMAMLSRRIETPADGAGAPEARAKWQRFMVDLAVADVAAVLPEPPAPGAPD